MFGKHFQLNEQTIHIVEEIGRHMPGGFFIYKAELPEELLYANEAVLDIFGCRNLDEFKELTGYTFKGMLHPDDYRAISDSIIKQIANSEDKLDYVEYRIIRKDGAVRWVDDYGHYTDTEAYGGIYYVFISDITDKRRRRESAMAVRRGRCGNGAGPPRPARALQPDTGRLEDAGHGRRGGNAAHPFHHRQ